MFKSKLLVMLPLFLPLPSFAKLQCQVIFTVNEHEIVVFDHSNWWWEPSNNQTSLVFAPDKYSSSSADQSLQISTRNNVNSRPPTSKNRETFNNFLIEKKLTIKHLPLAGEQFVIEGNSGHHKMENAYGDFAWDLVKLDSKHMSYKNQGKRNEDFFVWNAEVFSPVTGTIVEISRHQTDNPASLKPPEKDPVFKSSNFVGIHISGNYYLYLLHFRQGSIPNTLKVGDSIRAGTYLGRVGNSGVSYVPHLHMTMFWWDQASNRYWSIPGLFENISAATLADPSFKALKYLVPQSGHLLISRSIVAGTD